MTFVVAGAGYAGIEIGAEANNLLHSALRFYPGIRPEELHVTIISSTPRILTSMTQRLAAKGAAHLTRRGVTLRLNTSLTSATSRSGAVHGRHLQTRTIIVTAGIAPHPVVKSLPVDKDRIGRIKTESSPVPNSKGCCRRAQNAWHS